MGTTRRSSALWGGLAAAVAVAWAFPTAARAANATVNVNDFSFNDSSSGTGQTTINVGDTVTWSWMQGQHSTSSGICTGGSGGGGGCYDNCSGGSCAPDGVWDSGVLSAGQSFSRTFDTAGTYHYYCSIHGSMMTGQVIVNIPVATTCTADSNTLCLNGGRFQVRAQWTDFQGHTGLGNVVPGVSSDSSGLFWFFNSNNWEMLVKTLNGCGVNAHYWVFGAATTNVQYTLTVTDTQSGQVKTYSNPLGTSSPAITDSGAFSTCP
jgi:plastocyanin